MPGSAIVLTKEEMDLSWEQKISKSRVHHAKMHSRIRKMQSDYQRNLDAFDLEHRRRMEAAEKRRTALLGQRGKSGVTKCTCDPKKSKKKLRKKSVDAAGFNRKSLNRQLSHSASDLLKNKPPAEVATSPQGCVCCPPGGDKDDVLHISSTNITLTPRKDVKVEKKPKLDDSTKEPPKVPSDEADDENIFVRFLEWVGLMKEKDKEKVAAAKDVGNQSGPTPPADVPKAADVPKVADVPKAADVPKVADVAKAAPPESKTLLKQFGSLMASVVSSSNSSKAETPAPEVAPPAATSKDAPVLAQATGVTPSRNVPEQPGKTVLYVNITPSRKVAPCSVANDVYATPKTQGIEFMKMYQGYVKDTAAKFLAISEAQNGTTPASAKASPASVKASPAVVVLPPKDPGQQKIAVSVVQADKMADGSSKLITNGDSKTEIKIVINRL